MKRLEYIYFNIYNHCIKRSYYPGELFVRLQTMYLLCLSAGGWVLLLQTSFLRFVRRVWFTSHPNAMLFSITIYLIFGLLFHYIFIVKEHDQKIFDKYAQDWDRNPNKKRDLLLSVLVTVAPYLIMASLKLFFPRPS